MAHSSDPTREERLAELREESDGARLPSGSKRMWRFLNWLYKVTGHDANPPEWIEDEPQRRE